MSYSVEWHPKTRKFLKKLPSYISARIVLKIKEVQEDPFRYIEHYEGKDYYKLRVGDGFIQKFTSFRLAASKSCMFWWLTDILRRSHPSCQLAFIY